MITKYAPGPDRTDVISMATCGFPFTTRLARRVKTRLRKCSQVDTDPDYCFFEPANHDIDYTADDILRAAPFRPDAVFLHWVSGFIHSGIARDIQIRTGAVIFQYLVDMAAFTGGCHYSWDCRGYEEQCGCCPGLHSSDPNDLTYRNLLRKGRDVTETRTVVIAPSGHLFRQAGRSSLFKDKPVYQIPIGLDAGIFKPLDKAAGRVVFGLPPGDKVIFLGSLQPSEKRKGGLQLGEALKLLHQSLSHVERERTSLLVAGDPQKSHQVLAEAPFKKCFAGYLPDDRLLALAYQASTLYLCPSIEDSGPMMINEAIMCGTPVVAFRMGVAEDLVIPGETGYLAELRNASGLAKATESVLKLSPDEYRRMSESARNLGTTRLSYQAQREALERLFEEFVQPDLRAVP